MLQHAFCSFLLLINILLYAYTRFCLPIHQLIDVSFQFLSIMTNATINIHMQALVWTYIFLFNLGAEWLGHKVS